MQKLRSKKIQKIRRKLIETTPLDITLDNRTKSDMLYEVKEVPNGIEPKLTIVFKKLKRKMRRGKLKCPK